MKSIIMVFVFFGGVIAGLYFLDPLLADVRADNYDNYEEYYFEGHCGEYYEDFLDRFITSELTIEQTDLITAKFEELLLEHNITEEELYDDMEITHIRVIEHKKHVEVPVYENVEIKNPILQFPSPLCSSLPQKSEIS